MGLVQKMPDSNDNSSKSFLSLVVYISRIFNVSVITSDNNLNKNKQTHLWRSLRAAVEFC